MWNFDGATKQACGAPRPGVGNLILSTKPNHRRLGAPRHGRRLDHIPMLTRRAYFTAPPRQVRFRERCRRPAKKRLGATVDAVQDLRRHCVDRGDIDNRMCMLCRGSLVANLGRPDLFARWRRGCSRTRCGRGDGAKLLGLNGPDRRHGRSSLD